MRRVRSFLRSFLGLRGKLTMTYTAVTVAALLAIEVLAIVVILVLFRRPDSYFQDIVFVLYPHAAGYLESDPPDMEGLQQWVDATYESGYASPAPSGVFDSPAAPLAEGYPFYVLSVDGIVLAAAPQGAQSRIGSRYTVPAIDRSALMFERARLGGLDADGLVSRAPDGTYYILVPVLSFESSEPLAIIALYVEPPPPWLLAVGPQILTTLLVTGLLLVVAITPFGALFGFVMSRGLTVRLRSLSDAADAWSRGDFAAMPNARGRDEVGELQERLINMAGQLQSLLQTQQELAVLQERNHLARELHDTVKQQVFAATMQLRAAQNVAATDAERLNQHLREVEKLLKVSQRDLTSIINEMRPAALTEQSLAGALQSHLDMWSQQSGIQANLRVQGERRGGADVERALYRVVQEGLANTAKHSAASRATIELCYTADYVTLKLADNGIGFDVDKAQAAGFGLQSIRERISELGGALTITSKPGAGTVVWAEVPL